MAELVTLLGFVLVKNNVIKSILAIKTKVIVMTATSSYLMPVFYSAPPAFAAGILVPVAIFNMMQALINIIPNYLVYSRIKKIKAT